MRSSTETIITALRILTDDLHSGDGVVSQCIREAADRLEELSKPQQHEPVAWASPNVVPLQGLKDNHAAILTPFKCAANTVPLYTTPPNRQPLSDGEIVQIMGNRYPPDKIMYYEGINTIMYYEAFRDAEKAHGIVAPSQDTCCDQQTVDNLRGVGGL